MKEKQKLTCYGLDAVPPFFAMILLSMQHVMIIIVDLAVPVLVVKVMGGTAVQTAWVVQMSMVAIGVGTLLQIQSKGIGSGYLIPHSTTSIFLAPSLLAVQVGGLSMVAGMTLMAGGIQVVLARLTRRFQNLFPLHLSGLILVVNGGVLAHGAFGRFIGSLGAQGTVDWRMPLVGIVTLTIMSGAFVKGTGLLRSYGLALGMTVGYLFSLMLGIEDPGMTGAVQAAPLFDLPQWQHCGFDFDLSLCLPFTLAALAVNAKSSGLIVQGNHVNKTIAGDDRKQRLSGGLLADGCGTLLAGFLGGIGTSMSAANASLSMISRVTARCVGYGVAAIFLLLVFFPKLTVALFYMPQPVVGGTMVCIGFNLVRAGVQMIRLEPLDHRRWIVVILPLVVGLWIEMMSPGRWGNSARMGSVLSSSISTTALLAFGLHCFFSSWSLLVAAWRHIGLTQMLQMPEGDSVKASKVKDLAVHIITSTKGGVHKIGDVTIL